MAGPTLYTPNFRASSSHLLNFLCNVMVAWPKCRNQNFGRCVTCNRACRIDRNGTVYLPRLQSLELVSEFYFAWESLPQIFALSCWRTLRVRVHTGLERFHDPKIRKQLLELVNTRVDLSIINLDWRYDLLQEEPCLMHRSSSTFFYIKVI